MNNTGVVYYWIFGCCTLSLEIHLQTSSRLKWKHISIIKDEKLEKKHSYLTSRSLKKTSMCICLSFFPFYGLLKKKDR